MRVALDGKQDFGNTPEGVVCRSRIRCSFRCISADFAERVQCRLREVWADAAASRFQLPH
jgi:hypothetical protein